MKRVQAFTLIELLVVVAIIGILAAIAVINLQRALTQARITKTQTDMITVAKAIEFFRFDKGVLLVDNEFFHSEPGKARVRNKFLGVGYNEQVRSPLDVLTPLTSPTPYLSLIPEDYFQQRSFLLTRDWDSLDSRMLQNLHAWYYFNYNALDPELPNDNIDSRIDLRNRSRTGRLPTPDITTGDYMLFGRGPGYALMPTSLFLYGIPYDPSNGIYSIGDFQYHSRVGIVQKDYVN